MGIGGDYHAYVDMHAKNLKISHLINFRGPYETSSDFMLNKQMFTLSQMTN